MERLTFQEITHADDLAVGLATIANLTSGDTRAVSREKRYISKNGEIVWVSLEISPMHVPGMRSTHSIAVIQDITARKLTEDVQSFLAHSGYERSGVDFFDALVRRLAERLDMEYAFVHRLERAGTYARSEACFADGHRMDPVEYLLAGTPCGELLAREVCSFPSGVQQLFPDDVVLAEWGIESYVGIRLQGYDGEPIGLLSLLGRKPLKRPLLAELAVKLVAVRASGELERRRASERELVERARADAEHERLEVQLRQAQKMEAVGQLAGGVAHDFNNMLSVILGFTEEALLTLPPDAPASADLREVLTAATRSADLTRQLLAFARKQTISPRRLDLNDAIAQMLTMLRRLIGEHLTLVWRPAGGACLVHMDPGQIDQILTNLVINASDAIASTGTITIETTTVVVAARSPRPHPDAVPGPYVVLTVRDDGCGIDEATRERIFEPFFTTKPQGQGTGLGLATVWHHQAERRLHRPGDGPGPWGGLPGLSPRERDGPARRRPGAEGASRDGAADGAARRGRGRAPRAEPADARALRLRRAVDEQPDRCRRAGGRLPGADRSPDHRCRDAHDERRGAVPAVARDLTGDEVLAHLRLPAQRARASRRARSERPLPPETLHVRRARREAPGVAGARVAATRRPRSR
ncbi:MAG: ATP-binding protein [Proteobacteria bacterium]|nr:ATP-binding protein [Pseudomonadota bacterium]